MDGAALCANVQFGAPDGSLVCHVHLMRRGIRAGSPQFRSPRLNAAQNPVRTDVRQTPVPMPDPDPSQLQLFPSVRWTLDLPNMVCNCDIPILVFGPKPRRQVQNTAVPELPEKEGQARRQTIIGAKRSSARVACCLLLRRCFLTRTVPAMSRACSTGHSQNGPTEPL